MPNEAPLYTARLAAGLCSRASSRPDVLGCFAEHLPPIDVPTFIAALAGNAPVKLRVAILGGAALPVSVPATIELTDDPTVANLWRNDAGANSGVRCVTLVTGPVAKINSLRTAQPLVSARDVRMAAEQDAISHLNTPERILFWAAVTSDPSVSDRRLLELASAVAAAAKGGQAVLLEREPHLIHIVGLLADPSVLAAKGPSAAQATIARNRALVERIRRLSPDDRRQVLAVTDDAGVGDALRAEARAVLAFARAGKPENLSRLTYANVLAILKAKAQLPVVQPTPKNVDEDEEPVRTPGRRQPMLGDEVALDLLLHDADDDLAGASKAFDDAVAPGNDEDVTEEVEFAGHTIARKLRSGRSALEPMLARLVTKDIWGGVIRAPGAPDLLAAVQSLEDDNARVLGFEPKKHDRVQDLIERAVKLVGLPTVLNAWEAYSDARASLLEHIYDLSDHPLMTLSNNPKARLAADTVIKAHASFLTAAEQIADALRKRNSYEPAKRLLAQVLALDLVFVTSGTGVSAIAAPTHPFHLWRWLAINDLVQNHREDLKELGETMLRELVTNPPPNGPNILMSPHVAELDVEQELVLVGEGMIAALPVFSDPQSRSVAGFRADPLATIARNLVRVAGHAKFGLRVVMIDPPSVAEAVRAMSKLPLSGGVTIPIHLEVLGTKPSSSASEEEQAELEELVPILYENGGTLLVHDAPVELDEISKLLANEPAHLAVVFEPGRGRTYPVDVTDPPVLSPLVLPRVYRYDAFDDRFSVVVAPDDSRFGPYYDIFEQAMSRPQDPFLGRHSGASDWQTGLEVLAKHALWTVIIDQSLEPTFRLGDAARLDWRSAGAATSSLSRCTSVRSRILSRNWSSRPASFQNPLPSAVHWRRCGTWAGIRSSCRPGARRPRPSTSG